MNKKDQLSAKIEIAKDGPYLVMGKIPLAKQTIVTDANGGSQIWREGDAIRGARELCAVLMQSVEAEALLRNKPFCDGMRAHVKFRDE